MNNHIEDLTMALQVYERLYFDIRGPLYKSSEVHLLIKETLKKIKILKEVEDGK